MVFMGHGVWLHFQRVRVRSVFSTAVCKIQASKCYVESLPLVMEDKRSCFSQGETFTVQLSLLDCPPEVGHLVAIWKPSLVIMTMMQLNNSSAGVILPQRRSDMVDLCLLIQLRSLLIDVGYFKVESFLYDWTQLSLGPRPKTNPSADCFQHRTGGRIVSHDWKRYTHRMRSGDETRPSCES